MLESEAHKGKCCSHSNFRFYFLFLFFSLSCLTLAIRTLREELPQFFDHGLCTTSIYASNVRLIEASHTNVSLQGRTIYFLLAGAVRWSFKMWFRDIEFEIQSIRVNGRGGPGSGGPRGFGGMGFGGGD